MILNLKYDNTIFVNICLPTSEDKREKIQALSLAKECYSMKLDLLTYAKVVDDAIRFVSSNKFKDNLRSSGGNNEKEESTKPDYEDDQNRDVQKARRRAGRGNK